MNNPLKYLIIFLLLFTLSSSAQNRNNLEVFYSLIDSSLFVLPDSIPGNSAFSVYTGNNKLLYNYVYNKLISKYPQDTSAGISLSYVIEDFSLNYGELFRKKFLGDYYLERDFLLSGNFVLAGTNIHNEFLYSFKDTVKLDDVKSLENPNHPFTKGNIPAEPFFESIPEPVLAIGTAATAVILFFILRSK